MFYLKSIVEPREDTGFPIKRTQDIFARIGSHTSVDYSAIVELRKRRRRRRRRRLSTPASLDRIPLFLSLSPFLFFSSFIFSSSLLSRFLLLVRLVEALVEAERGVVYSHLSKVKATGPCVHKSVNPCKWQRPVREASNPSQ